MSRDNVCCRRLLVAIVSTGWLLATSAPVHAGTARLLGLGSNAGYVADASDVLHWYGSLGDYPDRVDLEFGDLVNGREDALGAQNLIGHGGGVHARLGRDGRWGTAAFYFQDNLPYGKTDGAFSVQWSRNVGPLQVGLGSRFTTYGESRVGTEVGDRIDTQYFHQYGLGLRGEPWAGLRIEVAGEIVNSLAESSGALYHLARTDDWTTFGLRARGFVEVTPDLTVVPLVDHFRDQRGAYDDIVDGPVDRDARITSLGVGANFQPDHDNSLLLSCEYRFGREDLNLRVTDAQSSTWDVSERNFYQIRCRAGVESALAPWITARAAVQYVRVHDDLYRFAADEPGRTISHRIEAIATPLALGLSLRRGRFTVDFAYNDTAPINPGLVSEGLFNGDREGYSACTLGWIF